MRIYRARPYCMADKAYIGKVFNLCYSNYNRLTTTAAGPSPPSLRTGSASTPIAPYPPITANQPTSPSQPSKQTPPIKRVNMPTLICVYLSTGPLSSDPLFVAYPKKPQGAPCAGTSLLCGRLGGPPLPGTKKNPSLYSLSLSPPNPITLPAACPARCTHQANLRSL